MKQISGGTYESLAFLDKDASFTSLHTKHREAMFADFAAQAKETVLSAADSSQNPVPLIMCTGGFRTGKGIQQAIQEDGIDLIGLGRAAVVDGSLPLRLLASKNISDGEKVMCIDYIVTGGEWLRRLIPLKLVGGSVTTLWHQMQIFKIARKEKVRLDYSFEWLLAVELFGHRWIFFCIIALLVLLFMGTQP